MTGGQRKFHFRPPQCAVPQGDAMTSYSDLPHLNAILNASSALLLLLGFLSIRSRKIERHRNFMLSGLGCSAAFLVSYLVYHWHAGSVRFQGQGWIRPLYFSILLSHTLLAAAIVPLVVITLRYALGKRFREHRKVARWTFPLWIYVSLTGVIVYLMLYH
jgi:putative membrane protein